MSSNRRAPSRMRIWGIGRTTKISTFERWRIGDAVARPPTRRTTEAQSAQRNAEPRAHRKHEDTKAAHPSQLPADHADRRRWAHARLERVARSRPSSDDGRGPLGRVIGPSASIRRDDPAQQSALSKSADLATPPLHFMVGRTISPPLMEVRRNRPAPGASAGGKHGDDGRLRPELTCFPPAGGDRQIADCSAVNLCHRRMK